MKTARKRAYEFLSEVGYAFPARSDLLDKLELSFKEHARDQRHLCAEQATEEVWDCMTADAIHAAIMNIKTPGEE